MSDVPQPGGPEDPDDRASDRDGHQPTGPALPSGVGLPFDLGNLDLSQLMGMLQSPGPVNWEVARQVANALALEGAPPRRILSADHEQMTELAHAAQNLVVGETGLAATFRAPVRTIGPAEWVELHLRVLRPVLEALATTLERTMTEIDAEMPDEPAPTGIPGIDLFGGMLGMLAPMLLGLQSGSLVGSLAQHALGRYDLPLPTDDEPTLCFVIQNLDDFEAAWELPRADLRFYVAIHEVVHAAQRSVPWVRDRLVALTIEYVSGYELDNAALETQLGSFDPMDPSSIAGIAEHPEQLLAAMQTPRQLEVMDRLQVLTATLEGHADVVLERVGERLIPSFARIHEAMKRHRLERGEAERFIEGLLGLKLDREHYERGEAFARGVVERAGHDGLQRLWTAERMLPTPAELEAPGLWLARIDLPED